MSYLPGGLSPTDHPVEIALAFEAKGSRHSGHEPVANNEKAVGPTLINLVVGEPQELGLETHAVLYDVEQHLNHVCRAAAS